MLKQSEVRAQLVEVMKEHGVDLTLAQAEAAVKAVDSIREEDLLATGKTKIPGTGTVEIRYRKARTGRNPKTNEEIAIPESLTIGLSASKSIKDALSEKVDIANYRK